MHGPDLLYLIRDAWPWGKAREASRVHHARSHAAASKGADCRVLGSRTPSTMASGSAQREAQMLVRLSIIGAVAAILMIPTTLSAQGVGGAVDPGGAEIGRAHV